MADPEAILLAACTDLREQVERGESASTLIERFQQAVFTYYSARRRSYPWRETADPYAVLVSEVMLQQTQADRVVGKYEAFMAAFPTLKSLAGASVAEVLLLWQGLGYNRRALNLRRTCQRIVDEHNGNVPTDLADLIALPGIGPYTAGAIRAFAFNLPGICIETNIRRLFIFAFFPLAEQVSDRDILPLVAATAEGLPPRDWYYALMDVGAYLGRALPNPNRRSSHYVRQSQFEGSNRQLRGRILKLLSTGGNLPLDELGLRVGVERSAVEGLVAQLAHEGFLTLEEGEVGLAR